MTWRVLITAPYFQRARAKYEPVLRNHGIEPVYAPVGQSLTEAELIPMMGDVDGVLCGDDEFSARVIAAAPRLKVICKWGTGIDAIDLEAAKRRGIPVRNSPNAFSEAVADTVLAYVLSFARQIPWMDRDVRSGRWDKRQGRALNECKLGVIGLGNIGRAVLRRAEAFGMTLLGHDVVPPPADALRGIEVEVCSKEDLLRGSDFVSLNCNLSPASRHLIGVKDLSIMKPTAILVNTARGPLIDEAALVKALQSGRLGGAGLDVYEVEPLPGDSPLRTMENVLLGTHNSNSSPAAWERVHENSVQMLVEGLRTAPIVQR